MKRRFLVLGVVLSCLMSLTACGGEAEKTESYRYSQDMTNTKFAKGYAEIIEDKSFEQWYINGVTPESFDDDMYLGLTFAGGEPDEDFYRTVKSGYISWYKALDEVGFNQEDFDPEQIKVTDNVHFYINDDDILVVEAELQMKDRTAILQYYMGNDNKILDVGVTVNKSFSEKLANAGLNTLLGMGMAFAILILISLIICLFPVLFGEKKKKKVSDKDIASKAMENTINQIVEQEDLSGDSELVAVIAAAIAAYEGSGSTDGFRVRSIRKVNNNWKKF